MKDISCRVLVIGSGPAGSSAALFLAERKIETLLIEKKKTPEQPTRCAEFVPAAFVRLYEQKLDCLAARISSMKTFVRDRLLSEIKAPGYVIDRKTLVEKNIKLFKRSGGSYMDSVKAVSIKNPDQRTARTYEVTSEKKGRRFFIYAELILIATGDCRSVYIGMDELYKAPRLIGLNQKIKMPPHFDKGSTNVYFSEDIFKGYGWLFPKGTYANLGIGVTAGCLSGPEIKKSFLSFAGRLLGSHYQPASKITSGIIPSGGISKGVSSGAVLLLGDAAGLCNPVTGAGIYNSVISARIAADLVKKAIDKDDKRMLDDLEGLYLSEFSKSMVRALKKRSYFEQNWQKMELAELVKRCWPAFRQYWD